MQRRVVPAALWSVAGVIAVKPVNVATTVFIAQAFGVAGLGAYAAITGVLASAIHFSTSAVGMLVARDSARGLDVSVAKRWMALLGSAVFIAVLVVAILRTQVVVGIFGTRAWSPYLAAALPGVLFSALATIPGSYLEGTLNHRSQAFTETLGAVVLLLGVITAGAIGELQLVFAAWSSSQLAVFLGLYRAVDSGQQRDRSSGSIDGRASFLASAFSATAAIQVGRAAFLALVVREFGPATMGAFAAVQTVAGLANSVTGGLQQVVLPTVSHATKRRIEEVARTSATTLGAVSSGLIVISLIILKDVITLVYDVPGARAVGWGALMLGFPLLTWLNQYLTADLVQHHHARYVGTATVLAASPVIAVMALADSGLRSSTIVATALLAGPVMATLVWSLISRKAGAAASALTFIGGPAVLASTPSVLDGLSWMEAIQIVIACALSILVLRVYVPPHVLNRALTLLSPGRGS